MNERMNERTNGNHRYEGYDGMVETEPIRLIKVYRMRARRGTERATSVICNAPI